MQDVLLLYYTRWCGYCQAVEPVLLTVARFFQNMSDVIIARYSFRHNILVIVQCNDFSRTTWEKKKNIKSKLRVALRIKIGTRIGVRFCWEMEFGSLGLRITNETSELDLDLGKK